MSGPIARNAPCPCGSGLRYKECHGKLEGADSAPDELVARALHHHQQGRIDEAERLYKQVLAADATHAVATHFSGMVQWHRGDRDAAERLMRESIARNPSVPDFHNNLGLLLRDTGRLGEALASFAKTLEIDPGWLDAYGNRGLTLEAAGRWDEAVRAYRDGLACAPQAPVLHQNLARLLLAMGRFEEGWEHYRWRLVAQGLSKTAPDPSQQRLGDSLEGRRIQLKSEQGLGDVLFFLRFAPELRRRGARLAFEGDPRLAPLLARTGLFEPLADPTDSVFIGNLPWLTRAHDPGSFPRPLELMPDGTRVARWRDRLRAWGQAPYVALTWRAGTVSHGPVSRQLKEVAPTVLAQAARSQRATWICVQRQPRPGEREAIEKAFDAPVHDASASNDDLEDMLALMSVVDDYVGVSNANTHLRAGRGGSMRVLVPFPPEWRWMIEGDRSPWFPTMAVARLAP